MRKITSLLVLFCMCVATAFAQNSLRISEGLLTTQEGTQFTWTSGKLTLPEGDTKLRITFMKTSNNEKPAGFPCVAIAEFYLYDKDGNQVTLTEDKFSSNATHIGEGSIAELCDGATSQQDGEGVNDWYWHSQWSGTPSPYGYHYLEVDLTGLTADLSEYQIGWVTRRTQASPREVIISTGATTNEAAMNANREMLPEVSTEAVRLYTIKSVRSKKFLAYDESQAKPQQIETANNNCYWYFTNGADGKVVMHNVASGKVLGSNCELGTEGEWFVSPAGYRPGVVFSNNADVTTAYSCIDDQSGSIGPWHHGSGDNEGTTWLVEEATNASVDVPVLSLNRMKISSIGAATTELVLDKWYILNNVGRGNIVSQELNNWKVRARNSVADGDLATDKAGYLFKITKNGEYYNIMSGNGKFFQLGNNSASTSVSPVNFEIGKIADSQDIFYLFDKDHGYSADGQETNNGFVGWATSHPTSAGGNDSYRLLPVELFDLVGALKTELADAKTMYASLPKGEGVGKYTAPADIESQFGALEEFCEGINNNTSIAEINDKIAELEALKASVTLNMPVAGKFYRMNNDGYYITSGVTDGGRIALSQTNNDAASVYYYDGSHLIAYGTGLYIGLNKDDWTFEAVGSNDISAIEFVAAANGAVAKYNIMSGGRWLHRTDNYVNRCSSNPADHPAHNWTITEVTWLPIPMNTTAGYATLISPVALSTYDWQSTTVHRVEAYVGKIEGDNFKMTRIDEEDGVIPANTPVVLKYVKGYEESKKAVFLEISSSEKEAVAEENNDLRGTFADTYVTTEAYALGLVDGEVGFYTAKMTDGQWLNNGFKAYLPMPAGSNVQALRFNFDGETTAIETVETENANAPIYDLSGRRVLSTVKGGIYIQNGKKFIVK
ncbi:MAG: hypothetical protein IIV54_01030 [Bacteroidaceae bacterium]|nr:hypothetical protein [Bacteroidaceae bacterium]